MCASQVDLIVNKIGNVKIILKKESHITFYCET